MNDEFPMAPVSPDDLAAYALDAHDAEDADDAAAIAAHLDTSSDAARREHDLPAAGEYAVAVVKDITPPPDLRARIFGEATRRRAPASPLAGASRSTFTASSWREPSCCAAT